MPAGLMLATRKEYPRAEESARPYRIWDATQKKALPHRCYLEVARAHYGCMRIMRWAEIGSTVEIYHAVTGRMLGQYTRRVGAITFLGGDRVKQD